MYGADGRRKRILCRAVLEDEVPGLPKDEEVEEGVGDDGRIKAARPLGEAMGGQ